MVLWYSNARYYTSYMLVLGCAPSNVQCIDMVVIDRLYQINEREST